MPLGTEIIWKHSSNALPNHIRYLAIACRYLFDIRPVTYTGRNVSWGASRWDTSSYGAFIVASGSPEALAATRATMALFDMAIARGLSRRRDIKGRAGNASYRYGAAVAILERAKADKLERDRLARQNASQVYGLVLADSHKLDKFHRGLFPNLGRSRQGSISDPAAANAGVSDGQGIALNRSATIGGRRLLGA